MAKSKEDLIKERDSKLSDMEHNYNQRQYDLENERSKVKQEAEEKQANGQDCSAEINRYKELGAQQDKNYDEYKYNREQIYESYESEISGVEEEYEEEEEYEY